MQTQYYKEWSHCLQRDMEFKVYGHAGKPVLVLPSQNGKFFDYEGFGMIEPYAGRIEAGEVQVFSIDSLDGETFDNKGGDLGHRMYMHEQWIHYITDEVYPRMMEINGSGMKAMVTGCSMGAYHAANVYFRRPDLFDKCLAQSGVYETKWLLTENPGYGDSNTYNNSPTLYLKNLPYDHFYMDLYRQGQCVIVVGQGAWDEECLASTRDLDTVCAEKGIPVWFDYWGFDVNHDWPWWKVELGYFLDKML